MFRHSSVKLSCSRMLNVSQGSELGRESLSVLVIGSEVLVRMRETLQEGVSFESEHRILSVILK